MRPIGGFIIRMAVSKETDGGEQAVLAILSLVRRIPFPGKTETGWLETGSNFATRRGQTEHAVLARPFGREFAKTRDTHSIRQTTFDGRLDEVGCKECERDRHVDLAHAAVLSLRDRFNSDCRVRHEFAQPPSSC